jgi:hypothetical protein
MYTTTDEHGILNNYATEPKLYYAEYPTKEEQKGYAFQGLAAMLLLTSVFMIALIAS